MLDCAIVNHVAAPQQSHSVALGRGRMVRCRRWFLRRDDSMRYGTVFPQTEIGADPIGVRDYAQAVEGMGYDYILVYDHVLGANAGSRSDWRGAYRHTNMFHEPFVLFGYLAGLTNRVELATGILILPQRQTALVAKQAAEADVLSGGRVRLGIGIGWNAVEFEALGENFHDRGRRSEEQIELMRALWTEELVTYEGRWHKVTDAGINPLPVQRPIPVWLGGYADQVLRRIGTMSDGWVMAGGVRTPDACRASIDTIHEHALAAGRDAADIGLERVVKFDIAENDLREWLAVGLTHV